MDTPIKDGGPAFPYAFQHEDSVNFSKSGFAPGMTLRDWFAGQALQGDLASQSIECGFYSPTANGWQMAAAMTAYSIADAMLAARKKGQP